MQLQDIFQNILYVNDKFLMLLDFGLKQRVAVAVDVINRQEILLSLFASNDSQLVRDYFSWFIWIFSTS